MRFLDEFVPYLLYLQLIILNVTNKPCLYPIFYISSILWKENFAEKIAELKSKFLFYNIRKLILLSLMVIDWI